MGIFVKAAAATRRVNCYFENERPNLDNVSTVAFMSTPETRKKRVGSANVSLVAALTHISATGARHERQTLG